MYTYISPLRGIPDEISKFNCLENEASSEKIIVLSSRFISPCRIVPFLVVSKIFSQIKISQKAVLF